MTQNMIGVGGWGLPPQTTYMQCAIPCLCNPALERRNCDPGWQRPARLQACKLAKPWSPQ